MKIKALLMTFFISTIFACSSDANAQSADENFWIGKYEHEDGGGKELEELKVKKSGDRLTAIYRAVITAQLLKYYSLTVEVNGNTASFYFDECLSKEGDEEFDGYEPFPCKEDTNRKGNLMFKLVKSVGKNKKTIVKTIAEKFADVEKYNKIFFEKVK